MQGSTLVKRLNAGENPNTVASEELPKWNKGRKDGKLVVLPGLTARRAKEVVLFRTTTSSPALPCSGSLFNLESTEEGILKEEL